jgi:glycosyltransferase involved in cell wall biosynthesis
MNSNESSDIKNLASDRKEEAPLFSAVIPTYNRPDKLHNAIDSVFNQSFKSFEVIVVNDYGSSAQSVIADFPSEQIRYFEHEENRGLGAARNTGIRNANGKYIAVLDDDDLFYPHHFETAAQVLSEAVPVIYTDAVRAVYELREGQQVLLDKHVPYSVDFDRNILLIANIAPVNCFVFSKKLAVQAGLFDEALTTLEDWEFWIRLSALTPFKHIPVETVEVFLQIGGSNMYASSGAPVNRKNRERILSRYLKEIEAIPNSEEILERVEKIWARDRWLKKGGGEKEGGY